MKKYFFIYLLIFPTLIFLYNCSLKNNTKDITIAFQYHKPTEEELNFLSNFDIVVTGNFWEPETVKVLKAKKVKLIYYDWLPAFYYCDNHTSWEEMLYQNRNFWILDPQDSAPDPFGEKFSCRDFFYDMANEQLLTARVDHIISEIKTNQYDGVFFDWGSGWQSIEENKLNFIIDEFNKRHPGIDYNDEIMKFIKKLKEKGILVILNGGFRSDRAKLDTYADFDIVESMFTTTECNSKYEIYTFQEGIQSVCDTWFNNVESCISLSISLPDRAKSANPDIRFLFLNYAFPFYMPSGERTILEGKSYRIYEKTVDRQAIFYALSCSYMGNSIGFVNGFDVSLDYVMNDIYNFRIGKPVSSITKLKDGIYIRYFSKGFIVVSGSDAEIKIAVPEDVNRIFDIYEKKSLNVENNKLILQLSSQLYPSGLKHPIGRIYLYEHR